MRRTPRSICLAVLATGLLAGTALLGAGCADDRDGGAGDGAPTSQSSASAGYPVTVGSLTLPARPTRIVSLSPTATEMLFAVGAGDQVTAVDTNSNYPAGVPKSDLSGFEPNAEAIAAKDPDLVVISNDLNKVVASLTKLKIPVYLAPAAVTLDDTYREISEIGALTGHPAEAADLVRRMRDDIAKLVKDVPQRATKLTYYYELDPTFYTVTAKTFVGSLFSLAGLENIAPSGAAGDYPQLSAEAIVNANPDMIFLADTKCCQQSAETVRARPGWASVTAVKQNQVYALDDDIASRWGPRVVDLVRTIVDAAAKVSP
jgi:iron complex transport system substrate-binding protein